MCMLSFMKTLLNDVLRQERKVEGEEEFFKLVLCDIFVIILFLTCNIHTLRLSLCFEAENIKYSSVIKDCNRLPREGVGSPSLDVFQKMGKCATD